MTFLAKRLIRVNGLDHDLLKNLIGVEGAAEPLPDAPGDAAEQLPDAAEPGDAAEPLRKQAFPDLLVLKACRLVGAQGGLAEGGNLRERYDVDQTNVGEGTFGVVRRAVQRQSGRPVSVFCFQPPAPIYFS